MRWSVVFLVACGAKPPAPAAPAPSDPIDEAPFVLPPREDAALAFADPCLGGDCVAGNGVRWTWHGDGRVLEVGRFANSRLVDGAYYLSWPDHAYRFVVAGGTATLDRAGYQIEAPLDGPFPWRAEVAFPDGDRLAIEWRDGITGITGGVAPSHHRDVVPAPIDDDVTAAAIVLAGDIVRIRTGELAVDRLETAPPLVRIRRSGIEYVHRLGLVHTTSIGDDTADCVAHELCELAVEGPGGQGIVAFEGTRLVARPIVARRPHRAWQEVVPHRFVRARADLIEAERALADARTAIERAGDLAAVREMVHHAVAELRDAADAIDDAIGALPQNHVASLQLEDLRDELADELVKTELVADAASGATGWTDLAEIAALPAIINVRVDLRKIKPWGRSLP